MRPKISGDQKVLKILTSSSWLLASAPKMKVHPAISMKTMERKKCQAAKPIESTSGTESNTERPRGRFQSGKIVPIFPHLARQKCSQIISRVRLGLMNSGKIGWTILLPTAKLSENSRLPGPEPCLGRAWGNRDVHVISRFFRNQPLWRLRATPP